MFSRPRICHTASLWNRIVRPVRLIALAEKPLLQHPQYGHVGSSQPDHKINRADNQEYHQPCQSSPGRSDAHTKRQCHQLIYPIRSLVQWRDHIFFSIADNRCCCRPRALTRRFPPCLLFPRIDVSCGGESSRRVDVRVVEGRFGEQFEARLSDFIALLASSWPLASGWDFKRGQTPLPPILSGET